MKTGAQQSQVPIVFPSFASAEGRDVGHVLMFVIATPKRQHTAICKEYA